VVDVAGLRNHGAVIPLDWTHIGVGDINKNKESWVIASLTFERTE
jgi:hypothetical protein